MEDDRQMNGDICMAPEFFGYIMRAVGEYVSAGHPSTEDWFKISGLPVPLITWLVHFESASSTSAIKKGAVVDVTVL
jgi:hypothetical protein